MTYSHEQNTLVVIPHGSQNAADWGTNYDAHLQDFAAFGFKSRGRVHAGFAKKFQSFRGPLLEKVDQFVGALSAAERSDLKILVSGHSQGPRWGY
jgi:hypothetical protein